VSLILDALKKVEREKDAHEPNVLVVGSVPWGTRAHSRRPLVLAALATAVVALAAFALWPRERAARPGAPPSGPAFSRAPAPTPGTASVGPPATPAPAAVVPPPEPRRLSVPEAQPAAAEAPPSAPAPATDDLRLNAISQRDGRPVALINDRLVFEGDAFDDVKVLRIGEAEVEIEVRGRRRVLRF
jgi:hypothetical protein